jgi:hypothetical protein
MRTPEQCAQAQLEAYNDHNIDRFAEVYHSSIKLEALIDGQVFVSGHNELRQRYGQLFEQHPTLHCELVHRTVCGSFVIDEERVSGLTLGTTPVHAVATYHVRDGFIVHAWFIRDSTT